MANAEPTKRCRPVQRHSMAPGQRFGRLVTLRRAPDKVLSSGRVLPAWICQCDCGNETTVLAMFLPKGHTQSCGCLKVETAGRSARTHGATGTPEFRIWSVMIQRCHKVYSKVFEYYGGRGIGVCDRWRYGEDGKSGFECFIADIGYRPDPSLWIDRINNDGNYEPGNVRWATPSEQARNQRKRRTRPNATHCQRGHPLSLETAYLQEGRLRCKVCHARRVKKYTDRLRAQSD